MMTSNDTQPSNAPSGIAADATNPVDARRLSDRSRFSWAFQAMADALDGKVSTYDTRGLDVSEALDKVLIYLHEKPFEVQGPFNSVDEELDAKLRPSGIGYRRVRLTPGWQKECIGPLLAWTNEGKSVALIPNRSGRYCIHDCVTGTVTPVNDTTVETLKPDAYCIYRPLPQHAITKREFLSFIMGTLRAKDVFLVFLAAALATAIGMLLIPINDYIFSEMVYASSVTVVAPMACLLGCITVSMGLIQIAQGLVYSGINTKMTVPVQAATMMRLLSLPAEFFRNYSSGELASRMQSVGNLCSSITTAVLATGISAVFSLVYMVQMFARASELVFPAVAIVLITTALSFASIVLQTRVLRKKMALAAKQRGVEYELVTGIRKIRLCGAEKRMFSKWADCYQRVVAVAYRPPLSVDIMAVAPLFVSLMGTVVLYGLAVANNMSVGDYMAFNVAYGMVTGAFTTLTSMVSTMATVQPDMEMVEPILAAVPENTEAHTSVGRLEGRVRLTDVSFRYTEKMPNVLDGLSLEVEAGEYLGIVGTTGSGKSTLVRLLLGFERPQHGAVYYDGRDIASLDKSVLRRNIGVVMQNAQLFSGDIYSNIVISAPWLTMDEAWEVAEKAQIAKDIRLMPMGMHTLISEGAQGISGGQRQRLAIARALAPNPSVLILDEATSALDNITQSQVAQALSQIGCTRIVIAHRLSTIRDCDRIVVLDKGKIAEEGTYDDLMSANGLFANMAKRQL